MTAKQPEQLTAILSALDRPKKERKAAILDALQDFLTAQGMTAGDARNVASELGWRPNKMRLIDLYQGAYLLEQLKRAANLLKRGGMTEIYASQASIWAAYSGQQDYGPEEFRKAYEHWRRKTQSPLNQKGGGLARQYRKGFE